MSQIDFPINIHWSNPFMSGTSSNVGFLNTQGQIAYYYKISNLIEILYIFLFIIKFNEVSIKRGSYIIKRVEKKQ